MTTNRTRRGWLTKEALRSGLTEQKVWVDEFVVKHAVELSWWKADYWVVHVEVSDAIISYSDTRIYPTLTEARAAFASKGAKP